ncbi:MAG TPA: ABC transporter permease [Vicinamibacterales bacterium]|nr:ABC transporter permease [Vicinamibacterales bacterium]
MRVRPFNGITRDLRLAARRLAATPVFLAFAVVSLAVGVAVPTTVYSILYELMWKPLGVVRPGEVALLTPGSARIRTLLSQRQFAELRRSQRTFLHVAGYTSITLPTSGANGSRRVEFEAVTGDYFRAVGVEPVIGRVLHASDSERRTPVVVIGERLWRQFFGADPSVIGRPLRIGVQQFDIVGVVTEGFAGLMANAVGADAWIPLETIGLTSQAVAARIAPDRRQLSIVGRLAPGRSIASASAELQAIGLQIESEVGQRSGRPQSTWRAVPITDSRQMPPLRVDLLLLAATFLVLLVACTNLGNLLLSRGAARIHELSVRQALGASRWRLVRELLAETFWIAALASAATVLVTRGLMWLVTMELPTVAGSFAIEPVLRAPALLVASAALLASVLLFGLEPAVALTRSTLSVHLASESGPSPVRRRRRQRAFIRWQVAVSVCFFMMAAVLARVLLRDARHDSGIALDRLAIASVHFAFQGWDEARARRALDRARTAAGEFSALASFAITSGMPFGVQMTPTAEISMPDRPIVTGQRADTAGVLVSSPEIFSTLGVPIVKGRAFDERDHAGSARVCVVSEYTALRQFGTRDAIGRQITYTFRSSGSDAAETVTVIGVARATDADTFMKRDAHLIYVPLSQRYLPNLMLVGRGTDDPAGTTRTLQAILRRADPDLSVGISGPARWLLAGPWVAARAAGGVAAALGALTLMLSMVGLYGVQSQAVAQRTREVGVRMALGAMGSQITAMILREGFRPVFEGFAIGLLVGTLARAGIRAVLVAPVEIVDPLALVAVPVPLAIAAFLACYMPARRAARVDPNVALRAL